ncbi:hypothetical protein D3C83_64710 [compost metagenome]
MQLVFLGQRLDGFQVRQAVHVDPAHGRPRGTVRGEKRIETEHALHLDLFRRVVDDGHLDRRGGLDRDLLLEVVRVKSGRGAGISLAEARRELELSFVRH